MEQIISQIITALIHLFGFLMLLYPLAWELHNDKDGDDHLVPIGFGWTMKSKTLDVWIRGGMMIMLAAMNHAMNDVSFFSSLMVSWAFHFFFFDYGIAFILGRSNWFSYLGEKSYVDNLALWRNTHPINRFVIRLVFLTGSILNYFEISLTNNL